MAQSAYPNANTSKPWAETAASPEVRALMESPAYQDASHPDHQRVSAHVRRYYEARFPEGEVN